MNQEQKAPSCMDKAKYMMGRLNPMTWFAKKPQSPPAGVNPPHVFQPAPPSNIQIQAPIDAGPAEEIGQIKFQKKQQNSEKQSQNPEQNQPNQQSQPKRYNNNDD